MTKEGTLIKSLSLVLVSQLLLSPW